MQLQLFDILANEYYSLFFRNIDGKINNIKPTLYKDIMLGITTNGYEIPMLKINDSSYQTFQQIKSFKDIT